MSFTDTPTIRVTTDADLPAILGLYPKAFPEEELRPVVKELSGQGHDTLSLAAFSGENLVGHVLFTLCPSQQGRSAALLAPLGVVPDFQQKGIGSQLVRTALDQLTQGATELVMVLGDPAYYGRFGFAPDRTIAPPYPIPEQWADAWQSLWLQGAADDEGDHLLLPEPWMKPELWSA